MPKFMVQVTYTVEGVKGLVRDGGSKRRAVVEKLISSAGGKLDGVYFAFGDTDVIVIADLPDNATAAAISLTVGSTGAVRCNTTPLLSAEEVDAACKKQLGYTAPGA